MIFGYARVSTNGQDLADQTAALTAAGAVEVFREKESGAFADRPQLRRALKALDSGDVLLVTRLDRLARSTRDLLNILHEVGERLFGVDQSMISRLVARADDAEDACGVNHSVRAATILTLAIFPVLVFMYVRLARTEEREALAEFGEEYRAYMAEVPGFVPRISRLFGLPVMGKYGHG